MKNHARNTAIALGFLFSSSLIADQISNAVDTNIAPLQAQTVQLQDHTAVIYYVVQNSGAYEVITTIGPNVGIETAGTQHRATLAIGQTYSLQLSQGNNLAPVTGITITAEPDSLRVATL